MPPTSHSPVPGGSPITTIGYYTPFKPIGFHLPSGDLTIATGLKDFLEDAGYRVIHPSRLRARWIYWKPWLWPRLARDRRRSLRQLAAAPPALWLTYHAYYKCPDLIGPWIRRKLDIPYIVFQGIYSTRRKKHIRTWPGYALNRRALLQADHVFSNRKEDFRNLKRLIPESRLSYIAPGIDPSAFSFDPGARSRLRQEWRIPESAAVVATAAMFRPGVKTRGLAETIRACAELHRRQKPVYLIIAGDGSEKAALHSLAGSLPAGFVRFAGQIPRDGMHRFYSAGDIFAFPGIRETLGMVYLEAQSCNLPVVAFENGGIPEVVRDGETGFLTPFSDRPAFAAAIARLRDDTALRRRMGDAAARYVRKAHDIRVNYRKVESVLQQVLDGHLSRISGLSPMTSMRKP